jgi:hypothetical protein
MTKHLLSPWRYPSFGCRFGYMLLKVHPQFDAAVIEM